MNVRVKINGIVKELSIAANETLLMALRREGYYSVKHGCETGECGACGVLMKAKTASASKTASVLEADAVCITNTCVMLAAQAEGAEITTVESLGKRNEVTSPASWAGRAPRGSSVKSVSARNAPICWWQHSNSSPAWWWPTSARARVKIGRAHV